MLQSLKVSEAGMLGQQEKLEILANNLANLNTPGFKRILSTLEAVPAEGTQPRLPRIDVPGEIAPNPIPPGSLLRVGSSLDLRSGPIEATGNPLDLAIEGEGFFVIQTAAGERYTRNGSFTLDPAGRLVTRQGELVVSDSGPIEVPEGAALAVAGDGAVTANGQPIGQLRVVVPASAGDFAADGTSLYRTAPGRSAPEALPAERLRIQPGFLEGSNANPISELVAMITAQRIFEAGQRVLSAADETLRRAVNEIPKIG